GFFFGEMARPPYPELVGERWRAMWLERMQNLPVFLERWLSHQHRDAYWQHGSVCEDYGAITCPTYVVGGWTDGYTNAVPRLLQHLDAPRKGLIGPWAHAYPHFALPGPQIGFLQETVRWWDRWLKGIDNGVMNEPMLRTWMCDSVKPAAWHEKLPGRWIVEPSWPPPDVTTRQLFLTDAGLSQRAASLTARSVCSPLTMGKHGGEWCPFGRGQDQADDQREDDALSLIFDTPALDESVEILGAPVITLDIVSDRPIAQLIARLCDVHPTGESLRVSFGVLNLTHRDSHASPTPLIPGERYRVRIQLNDAAARFPTGHRMRLALSTSYWPMVWPAPQIATVTVLGGTLALPVRPVREQNVPPLPPPEMAAPERTTKVSPGVVRIDRLGLQLGSHYDFKSKLDDGDPLSAMIEMRRRDTIARDGWRVRIDTSTRMTCTRDAFLLAATLEAWEGDEQVLRRRWDRVVPRDLV
ncbi:MAG: CocE/NonD family hydrolase, partial [Alphaproteobacteria bacterium]|nr:CocE/NonD family hydrolase [Alphaproteobacteria bacterium]